MKRLFDLAVALLALPLALPLTALLIVAIRIESHGPGLLAQPRVGRDGKPFHCLKLRTMTRDAPNAATHLVGDAHVTRLGAFLRRQKLDEMPQLWNVLLGEMSLVGPRPCLPSQKELIRERRARGVLALRPGITGLAQVNGIDMKEPARLARVDAAYLALRSFAFDLRILVATVLRRPVAADEGETLPAP